MVFFIVENSIFSSPTNEFAGLWDTLKTKLILLNIIILRITFIIEVKFQWIFPVGNLDLVDRTNRCASVGDSRVHMGIIWIFIENARCALTTRCYTYYSLDNLWKIYK